MPKSLTDRVQCDGWSEVWSSARAARFLGVTEARLRCLAELDERSDSPRLRWDWHRTRGGVAMVFDGGRLPAFRAFMAERIAGMDVAAVARAIVEGAASTLDQLERKRGRLLLAPDEPDRLPVARAAELLGMTERAVRALCAQGRLLTVQCGESAEVAIEPASLAEFFAARFAARTRTMARA